MKLSLIIGMAALVVVCIAMPRVERDATVTGWASTTTPGIWFPVESTVGLSLLNSDNVKLCF